MKSILLTLLLLCLATAANAQNPNNTLRGKVLYQSSGNKPAVGVRISEPDATAVFSVDNGDYVLKFQNKRNGAALALEVGKDDGKSQKLELVNEKEVKAAKLPASLEELLDIIVCPAGQRDIAAQKYYRILRTTADRELEKKKKEVETLLAQKEKDYQKISDLFAQLDGIQAALDSAKIREQAFNIASINLDRASQLVKDAVRKIEEENDVEGALRILSVEALDSAYLQASALKKKAEVSIRQVIEGYEFKISLLEPQFKYGEIAECYEKIAGIIEKEEYNNGELPVNLNSAGSYFLKNGEYEIALELSQKALAVREKILPAGHHDFSWSYSLIADCYGDLGDFQKQLEFNLKSLEIVEKNIPTEYTELAGLYNNLGSTFGNLGNYQKKLEFNLKSLVAIEKSMPIDSSSLGTIYANLGNTYYGLGDYVKASEFELKSFDIFGKILPENHPKFADLYNNMAATCRMMGLNEKALDLDQKTLALREKFLPPFHPHIALSYNNISIDYYNLRNYQKSLTFQLNSLSIRENVLSFNHPDLAVSYNQVAKVYGKLEEFKKQLEFNLKSLAIREKILPAGHASFALSYNDLSTTYKNLGEYQEALKFSLKALDIGEKSLPNNHPTLVNYYNNLGVAYRNVKNYEKSVEYFRKAVYIGEVLKPKHLSLNRFYFNLGDLYLKMHNYSEAKEAFEKSESIDPAKETYQGLTICYAVQKQKKQAIESLQKAISLGFKDLKWLETEPDLKNIRKEKGYKEIVEQLKKQ